MVGVEPISPSFYSQISFRRIMKKRKKTDSGTASHGGSAAPQRRFPAGGWFYVVVAGTLLYLFAFFSTALSTLSAMVGATVTRFSLFSYLLVPEDLVSCWFAYAGEFALLERIGVLFPALAIVAAGFGIGSGVLMWIKFDSVAAPRKWTRLELFVLATALGLNLISTAVLAMGLVGMLHQRWLAFLMVLAGAAAAGFVAWSWWRRKPCAPGALETPAGEDRLTLPRRWLWFAAPPVVVTLLLGMIPSSEYDMNSYHLQGPREFFQQGSIGFMEHNVYTNMPLGAEMHCLLGMMIAGDWFRGAMIGKTVIAGFALLGGLAVWMAGRRLFSPTAGILGGVLYVSIPWIIYVSGNGLVEGVFALYQFLAIYMLVIYSGGTLRRDRPARSSPAGGISLLFLAGFFAGAAAATKYTAVPFVVLPIGVWTIAVFRIAGHGRRKNKDIEQSNSNEQKDISEQKYNNVKKFTCLGEACFSRRGSLMRLASPTLLYAFAVLLAAGLWYGKNYALTGNPVYPLAFTIFGDSTGTWDPVKNERWKAAHHARDFSLKRLGGDAVQVVLKSPWLAPLIVPFFLLGILTRRRGWTDFALLGYLCYVFLIWWFFTHRLDRFWMTVFPVFALYAGIGATWSPRRRWRRALMLLLVLSTVYVFIVSTMGGAGKYNRLFASYRTMRHDIFRIGQWAEYYNLHPPEGRLMIIGEAQAFFFDKQPYYNSCFDDLLLEEIVRGHSEREIRENFRRYGITDLYINWKEIERFRSPGNYGFPEFFDQAVIDRLVRQGILRPIPPLEGSPGRGYHVIWDDPEPTPSATGPSGSE